jgi:hypothetical protein
MDPNYFRRSKERSGYPALITKSKNIIKMLFIAIIKKVSKNIFSGKDSPRYRASSSYYADTG